MTEKEWFKKIIQAILALNKSDIEKAEEIAQLFEDYKVAKGEII